MKKSIFKRIATLAACLSICGTGINSLDSSASFAASILKYAGQVTVNNISYSFKNNAQITTYTNQNGYLGCTGTLNLYESIGQAIPYNDIGIVLTLYIYDQNNNVIWGNTTEPYSYNLAKVSVTASYSNLSNNNFTAYAAGGWTKITTNPGINDQITDANKTATIS